MSHTYPESGDEVGDEGVLSHSLSDACLLRLSSQFLGARELAVEVLFLVGCGHVLLRLLPRLLFDDARARLVEKAKVTRELYARMCSWK